MADIIDLGSAIEPEKLKLITEGQCAQVFAEKYRGELLFNEDEARWYRWTGTLWRKQRKGLAADLAHRLARDMARRASNREKVERASWAGAMTRLVGDREDFARLADAFDSNPMIVGSPELTLNLADGDLRPPDQADMITKSLAVAPHIFDDCPLWRRFLGDATGNDEALIQFLQRWCGYCLSGLTSEHALVFIYGDGGNGKTVFANTIAAILGDYAATASMDTFAASKHERHPTEVAMLRGARLVTASETEEGRAWNEARIKQLTGGEPVSARFMRQDFFEFRPTFKLMIIGNHQPVLHNVDDAMRRRVCMVPFTRKPANPDPNLEAKLREEWPAILRWMINGCLDWRSHGLPRPEAVLAANEEYFENQDLLGQWIDEACETDIGNAFRYAMAGELHASYTAWCKAHGEPAPSIKGFSSAMTRRGFRRLRVKAGTRLEGVSLKSVTSDPRFSE